MPLPVGINRALFREMFGFVGWNFIGNMGNSIRFYGTNILLNLFFGPMVNTAQAIANQVNTAVFVSCRIFRWQSKPQIHQAICCRRYDRNRLTDLPVFAIFVLPDDNPGRASIHQHGLPVASLAAERTRPHRSLSEADADRHAAGHDVGGTGDGCPGDRQDQAVPNMHLRPYADEPAGLLHRTAAYGTSQQRSFISPSPSKWWPS